ncbi:MAG: RNA methyltransferase [Bacteroidia bacterium]|nr:RNA methyltransferase [Bacteroidia bacterium]
MTEKIETFELLSSSQNPKIKFALELLNSKGRKKHGLFLAEGLREMKIALKSGFMPLQIFFNSDFKEKKGIHSLSFFNLPKYNIFEVEKKIFSRIAYREDTEGITGIFKTRKTSLETLILPKNPLIIVLESVEKPGNLGAVLRTADAANVDAVIICDPIIDLYNPNVIRSSIGCIFSKQTIVSTSEETINWLKSKDISIFSAALTADKYYHETNFTKGSAIVMGTEADGLSEIWLTQCTKQIKIPMLGKIDSLNVSNATAIIVFEAMRQRGFK